MSDILVFCLGLVLTLVLSLALVAYLRPHLRRILIDLCGTEPRADFWLAFSNVTLLLVPLIAALSRRPAAGDPVSLFFEISAQLRNALVGLILALTLLGLILSRYILRASRERVTPPAPLWQRAAEREPRPQSAQEPREGGASVSQAAP